MMMGAKISLLIIAITTTFGAATDDKFGIIRQHSVLSVSYTFYWSLRKKC